MQKISGPRYSEHDAEYFLFLRLTCVIQPVIDSIKLVYMAYMLTKLISGRITCLFQVFV